MGVFTYKTARAHGVWNWITPWLVALLAVATSYVLTQDPTCLTLMVSGTTKMIYLPATPAQHLGYFRGEGLDVELLLQPAGVDAESELLTGSAQGVAGFCDHTIDLQAKGKEVRVIVVFSQVPDEAEVVPTCLSAAMQLTRDLCDRMLGVTGLGALTGFLTYYLTVQQGFSTSDYAMLPADTERSFVITLHNGRTDADTITDSAVSYFLHDGEVCMLFDLRTFESTRTVPGGSYPTARLYLQTTWLEAHPSIVVKLTHAFVHTPRYSHTHGAEDIATRMPPEFRRDHPELYIRALAIALFTFSADEHIPDDGPSTVLHVLATSNANVCDRHVDLSCAYTNRLVDQVCKRRWLKSNRRLEARVYTDGELRLAVVATSAVHDVLIF